MKKLCLLMSILFLFGINCSCENEPYEDGIYDVELGENPTIPEDFQNAFYAKLNGQEFTEQRIYTTYAENAEDDNFIAITGSESFYHSIIIYLPALINEGTYIFNAQTMLTNPNLNITYSNLQNLLQSGIGDGMVMIETHDILNNYIKGTFECTVNSQNGTIQHISDGSFEVIYLE